MSFTGKATYSAGSDLPEIAEDVSDIIGIVSPHETPLLDRLGDPRRVAHSTVHEWIEDQLLPNTDTLATAVGDTLPSLTVANASRFQVGDQIRAAGSREVMLVTLISGNNLTITRGYGGTTAEAIKVDTTLHILGNAALEGDDAPPARFTTRTRKTNVTQIFTATVEVSGSQLAARQLALTDEMDYQKQERLRELVRDLEHCVINGVSPASNAQGSATVRRTMRGIISAITSNVVDAGDTALSEDLLNQALRSIWEQSNGSVDTIVVSGFQKRAINGFITSARAFGGNETRFRDLVSIYESDFGVCRVVLSRSVPADTMLLLDSSRIDVLPMAGRSFHFAPLAQTGDRAAGQIIGEYTLELRNENAHGVIHGLTTS